MQKTIRIRNLDCAACAAELTEELEAIEGVEAAHADFINQRVFLTYTDEGVLSKCVAAISGFEEVEIIDSNAPEKRESHRKELLSIGISAAFFVPGLILTLFFGGTAWIIGAVCCMVSFAAAGWEVIYHAGQNFLQVFHGRFSGLLDENLLMLIASVGAIALGEYMEAAAVVLLYQIGEFLQNLAVGSSRGQIKKLMALQSDTAIRVTENGQEEISPEELSAGDVILLRRGDRVPVDCVLLDESASLDTKSLTGEAYLREALRGEELLSGYVNEGNAVRARVLRPVTESAVAKILDLVENASAKKAKPEKFITKFARIYTPVVVLLAVLIAIVPPLFDGYRFALWVGRALNFLVISCPCALIISVPLTYFSGVGALAECGVLAKGAVGLDALAHAKVAAFDKTGTLTEGRFRVVEVVGGDHVLKVAAAAEKLSSHPLAQAFAEIEAPAAEACTEIAGMGIEASVEGKQALVGSLRLMASRGIDVCAEESDRLAVYVAEGGKYIGKVLIADRLRPEAAEALAGLKREGVEKIAVLTGDTKSRAESVLKGLPLDMVCAELMPEEKPLRAEELRASGPLLYVGDGINDTPVMAAADVSVAMGGLGSDAAIEASDFVLAGDLTALPKAIKGAKRTGRIVAENIAGSIAVKVALMALSLFGWIPLWAAVFGDVGVMLLAVLNSLRMRLKLK